MQVTIIVDASGKLIGAHRAASGDLPRTGIRPAQDDHTLYTADLPPEMEALPLHRVIERFGLDANGQPGWV